MGPAVAAFDPEQGDFRGQSYALALAITVRSLAWDSVDPFRAVASAAAAAVLYAQQFLAPRRAATGSWERFARPGFGTLASLVVAVLLYREISGSLLTMAWGGQGLLLLVAGFPFRVLIICLYGLFVIFFISVVCGFLTS